MMKKILILACTICLFVTYSSSQQLKAEKKVLIHELEDRGGIAYLPNEDKPFTGSVYAYFSDGKSIYLKSDFLNGKQHGKYIEYLQNGKVNYTRNYTNGREDGEWIEYYENGNIQKKEYYKNGQRHGEWITYFESGQMQVKGQFENGEEVGKWFQWDEKGNLLEQ